ALLTSALGDHPELELGPASPTELEAEGAGLAAREADQREVGSARSAVALARLVLSPALWTLLSFGHRRHLGQSSVLWAFPAPDGTVERTPGYAPQLKSVDHGSRWAVRRSRLSSRFSWPHALAGELFIPRHGSDDCRQAMRWESAPAIVMRQPWRR